MPLDNSVSTFAPMKMLYISGLMFISESNTYLVSFEYTQGIRLYTRAPSSEPTLCAEALGQFC